MQAVLDEAMTNRGLTRMAVLAPETPYGRGFERLFTREVENRGGKVVRTVFYNPQAVDFTAEVKRLVKLPPGRYRPGHPDSPKPVIDFDAVFIPRLRSPGRHGGGPARLFRRDHGSAFGNQPVAQPPTSGNSRPLFERLHLPRRL